MRGTIMTKQDIRRLTKDWSELDAAGIPLEALENRTGMGARNSGSGLTVRPGRPRWRCEIRALRGGRFGFIVPIFVRRDHPGKTTILDAWVGTSWPDTSIELLEDPKHEEKYPGFYNFAGRLREIRPRRSAKPPPDQKCFVPWRYSRGTITGRRVASAGPLQRSRRSPHHFHRAGSVGRRAQGHVAG